MLNQTIRVLSTLTGKDPKTIDENSQIRAELQLDRKDLIEAITELEDEFDIIIDYSRIDEIETVSDLEDCILQFHP